ncbi:MAG: thermitase, partial [Miltoncostaeaceae bacterium]|nr:thermitase [Miltoncostaeaceae bacterium]
MRPPRRRWGRITLAAPIIGIAIVAASATTGLSSAPAAQLAPATGETVPGEVLVGFVPGTSSSDRAEVARDADAAPSAPPPAPGVAQLTVDPGTSTAAAIDALEDDPAVAWVQPNYVRMPAGMPDDAWFPEQWGIQNRGQVVNGTGGAAGADADVAAAWDLVPGGSDPLVAVVDTGVALDHPDLASTIATNPGESGGGREANGIDDDGNGLVDDWRGWDFADDDDVPADPNGHGTLVAGTIAARANNGVGVAGVSGGARILPLRVVGPTGATDADIAAAFTYAARRGARVVNASLGGPGASPAMDAAMAAAPETLFVLPAGNAAKDDDVSPDYPCATTAPNAICVAATDQDDGMASFSSWGAVSVDLAAPGVNIISTGIDETGAADYRLANGTSVATPFVAGTAALLLRADPTLTTAQLKTALLAGAEPLAQLAGTSVTGGRLNALRSVQAALGLPLQGSDVIVDLTDPIAVPEDDPGLGEQRPLRGDGGTRAAAADRAAPRVTGLTLVRWTARVTLKLRVSETARVGATIARRGTGGMRVVARVRPRALRAGVRSLGLGRLGAGRYRVTVRAEDPAGNAGTAGRWMILRPAA